MPNSEETHFTAEISGRKLFDESLIKQRNLSRNPFELLGDAEIKEVIPPACDVFYPVPCAEEIVKVLEKYEVSVFDTERVLAMAKDIAYASTKIKAK